jgi:cephalosporin hydroxylase
MLVIDEAAGLIRIIEEGREIEVHPLSSAEAFSEISRVWLKSGWFAKHVYSFTWLGRPIIQLPEDIVRIQEVICRVRPEIIVETGVAHGGSLVFYASLLRLLGGGRVIGVDVEIRPHNRRAIESHELAPLITLVEGSSTSPQAVSQVRDLVGTGKRVLVVLDSKHTKDHVLDELRAYAPMISVGSYVIAADGIKELVAGGPGTQPDWVWNNPKAAAAEFVAGISDYVIEEPDFSFNEGSVRHWISHWSGGFVKRIR